MKKVNEKQKEYNREYMRKYRRSRGILTKEEVTTKQHLLFISNSVDIHKGKYDYSKVQYTNGQSKVVIVCPTHHDFVQTPEAHLAGQGCPACGHNRRVDSRKRKTHEQFVTEANQIHHTKYTYVSEYVNLISKIDIMCPDHGIFSQTPKAHTQQKQGCPMCANERRLSFFQSRGESMIEQYLQEHLIAYEKQKMFDGCTRVGKLRYDFFLPYHNLLIEFDGEQHFKFVKKFHLTEQNFTIFQERDNIKNQFAVDQGITLLRIKFDQQQNINAILTQTLN